MPETPPARRSYTLLDHVGEGFLACSWIMGFLLLCGLELRVWIEQNHWDFAAAVMVVLGILAIEIQRRMLNRPTTHIAVYQNGLRTKLALSPAPDAIASAVEERAARFGLSRVRTLYIPRTWSQVDAFATSDSPTPTIVFSGGAMSLGCGTPERRNQFEALVDHELAHIVHRDVSTYSLGRALLIAATLLTIVKGVWLMVSANLTKLEVYQHLFPRALAVDPSRATIGLLDAVVPSSAALATAIGVYSVGMLAMMLVLYVLLVRHREFWADRATLLHADATVARAALERLLHGPRVAAFAPHSFLGASLWHPSASSRLRSLADARMQPPASSAWLGAIVGLISILSVRFVLGSRDVWWQDLGNEPSTPVLIIAALFVVITLALFDCTLHPYTLNGRLPKFRVRLNGLAILVVSASVMAAALIGVDVLSWRRLYPEENAGEASAFRSLIDLELNDRVLLISSFPVIVLVGASFVLAFVRAEDRVKRFFYAGGLSVIVLLILSMLTEPWLTAYRTDRITRATTAILATYRREAIDRHAPLDHNDGLELAFVSLNAKMNQTRFQWPGAFFMFWQVPFQAPTGTDIDRTLAQTREPSPLTRQVDEFIKEYNARPQKLRPGPDSQEPSLNSNTSFEDGLRLLKRTPDGGRLTSQNFLWFDLLPADERRQLRDSLSAVAQEQLRWYEALPSDEKRRLHDTLRARLPLRAFANAFVSSMATTDTELNAKLVEWLDQFDSFTPRERLDVISDFRDTGKASESDVLDFYDLYSSAERRQLKAVLRGKAKLDSLPGDGTAPFDIKQINPADLYLKK